MDEEGDESDVDRRKLDFGRMLAVHVLRIFSDRVPGGELGRIEGSVHVVSTQWWGNEKSVRIELPSQVFRQLSDQDRSILPTQPFDNLVDLEPLDKTSSIRVNITYELGQFEQVEAHDGLRRLVESFGKPVDKRWLGDFDSYVFRQAEDFQERLNRIKTSRRLDLSG